MISKQTGIWSSRNSVWGSAVDPKTEIAISTSSGINGKYELPNGDIICNTGTVTAIDLKTGKTKWIFVVPYGRIVSRDGEDICNDPIYDSFVDKAEQGRCTIDPKGNRYIDDSKAKIIIPTEMSEQLPLNVINRAIIFGVVTISNGFVFIPVLTGDVYVLRLRNGKFVTRFECPDIGGIDSNGDYVYNRSGIQGGITVIGKRVIFYCGGFVETAPFEALGNIIQSINFDNE